MRSVRREQFISSARVAYHFNYKLREAIDLSEEERSLLLTVAVVEQEAFWSRLDDTLGTRYEVEQLFASNKNEKYESRYVRLPLLQIAAPEVYGKVLEEVKKKAVRKTRNTGAKDVGTLSVAEAKAFFKSITKG